MAHPILCPDCGRRLVFVVMVVDGYLFHTWQCDCAYRKEQEFNPPAIVGDICRAREWEDGSLVYEVDLLYEEDTDVEA